MELTESIQVKKGSLLYNELDRICFLSKNLYNASLYAIRQHYFNTRKYLNYVQSNKNFVSSRNQDYYALPTKVSQQTMRMADQNFKSFFRLAKLKTGKAKIPHYLEKGGRYVAVFTNQAISMKELKEGYIRLSGVHERIKIRDGITNIQQVRVIPVITGNCYRIEVIHKVDEPDLLNDNRNYASIDIGVNNLATVSFNNSAPFILNGRPLKSINQFYNKKKSKLQNLKSNKARCLNRWRNNKVNDYLHKSSRYIANQLAFRTINTLVIGKNKGWKQDVNIGRRNNQNFVSIPFEKFIHMLSYKCRLLGINVIIVNESHTSKCSFFDNEEICHHEHYAGQRVKRGLFRTGIGKMMNADLNGSLNIMRKAVGEKAFVNYPIEACSTPAVITPLK